MVAEQAGQGKRMPRNTRGVAAGEDPNQLLYIGLCLSAAGKMNARMKTRNTGSQISGKSPVEREVQSWHNYVDLSPP